MSIRNLLPDSSVVLYAPSKPHILVADWMVVLRPPSYYRFESGSLNARFAHVFVHLLRKCPCLSVFRCPCKHGSVHVHP